MKNVAIAVFLIIIIGGIWMLGTTEKDSNWSTGQVRENVSQFVESEKRANSALQQTININMSPTGSEKNADAFLEIMSELPETSVEQSQTPQKDNLRKAPDPDDPNPARSWSTEEKCARPVEYMNQVLAYLKEKRSELRNMRFEVGTTLHEWELKKKQTSRNVKGCEAVLRKAAAAYQKAEAENSWPLDFAYREYSKEEMQIKLNDYSENLKKAKDEDSKISNGLSRLRDTSMNQDHEIQKLEEEIKIYEDNLELIRSGKINSKIEDFMQKLDQAVADQEEFYKESLQTAEKEVLLPAETTRSEAESNLDSILQEFGEKKK